MDPVHDNFIAIYLDDLFSLVLTLNTNAWSQFSKCSWIMDERWGWYMDYSAVIHSVVQMDVKQKNLLRRKIEWILMLNSSNENLNYIANSVRLQIKWTHHQLYRRERNERKSNDKIEVAIKRLQHCESELNQIERWIVKWKPTQRNRFVHWIFTVDCPI